MIIRGLLWQMENSPPASGIATHTWKEHLQHLETVFNCLQAANIKIRLSKCQFFKQHLHYLGHFISKKGIQPLQDKIVTITNLAVPNNIDEICHFLGLTSYYRKFIPLFADITKPLNKVLQKDTKFQWSTQYQAASDHLKSALCKEPTLQYPNINKPCTVFTDASNYAFSGVLTQAVSGPNDLRPIGYTSGSFPDTQRWSVTEKEAFAVLF